MRLWGIGLLALLLVGVLMAIGQTGLFAGLTNRDRLGPPYFDDYEAGSIKYTGDAGRSVFVAQTHPDTPLILSGLPSYVSKAFRLPVDARPRSGVYNVFFRVDAAKGAQGALRVTINGIKRADVLLGEGRTQQQAEVQLTPSELAARQLDVKLALIGRGPLAECTPAEAMSAVVTILPQSGLSLRLDRPVASLRDKLALWGSLIPVDWEDRGDPADTAAMIAAARLVEKGQMTYFGEKGLSAKELGDMLKVASQPDFASDLRIRQGLLTYPIPLVSDIANGGARRFDRETTWRYSYNIADLPGGALPSTLDLHMVMGPLAGTRTTMVVMLNDRLVWTRALGQAGDKDETGKPAASQFHVNQSIQLPADLHKARNDLEITLTSYSETDMRCGAMRLIAAEMLPNTVLQAGPRTILPAMQLRAALQAAQPVRLASEPLTAPDAQAASLLLSNLAPSRLRFDDKAPRATVQVFAGDVAAKVARLRPGPARWIVSAPADKRDEVSAEPLTPSARALSDNVVLVVTFAQPPRLPTVPVTIPTATPSPTGTASPAARGASQQ
ncbi:hypothetical protein WBP07_17450 [Novosphingobium sp. BL-8A]|uniref:hypothetical protein n=1 Tax=Novosphingobium sp. BL-8A TaxID=3127639 RepID=UPI003756C60F